MRLKKTLIALVFVLCLFFVGCEINIEGLVSDSNKQQGQDLTVYTIDDSAVQGEIEISKFYLGDIKINYEFASGLKGTMDVNSTMLSKEDLEKLDKIGDHAICVNYKDQSKIVYIKLVADKIEENNNPGNNDNPGGNTENPGSNTENPGGNTDNPGGNTENPGGNTENPGGNTSGGIDPTNLPEGQTPIATLLALSLAQDQQTTENYTTTAIIEAMSSEEYGNCIVTDGKDSISVYGLWGPNGEKYNTLTDKPVVGDTVTITGPIKNYYGTIEFNKSTLVSFTHNQNNQSGNGNTGNVDGPGVEFVDTSEYYKDAVGKKGNELKLALRTITTNGFKKVSYTSLNSYLCQTDINPATGKIRTIYLQKEIAATWDGGSTWNKEHVWPRSQGWFQYDDAGCDAHHIRAVDSSENSRRGNKPFGTSASGGTYYVPSDNVKGDVARIIFYLLVRYSEADSYSITKVAKSMDMLLEWNKLDPVDDIERYRNEQVYKIQKNRNPFIDYPDYAYYIWNTSYLTVEESCAKVEIVIEKIIYFFDIDDKKRAYLI